MNKTFLTIMAVGLAMVQTPCLEAKAEKIEEAPSLLKVDRLEVLHLDSLLQISFAINPQRIKPGRDRQVTFTPILKSYLNDTDSVVLTPITLAGRNRYYTHLRNGDIEAGDLIYQAGNKGMVEYSRTIPWQSWMDDCEVIMREETQDCCRPVKPLCDTPIVNIGTIPGKITNAVDRQNYDYIALTGDETVELEAQGSAYVDFIVNRTEIRDNYRNNPRELKKIIETIDVIKNDPDASITRLSIKGFASPEGSYQNNVRLAMGRTEALKDYIRSMYDFDPEIMHTNYEPEDWDGLRAWLETATIPNRDGIMEIVNSGMAPDARDQAIKREFPKQYKLLLDSVYPGLRHSDYRIQYKIRTFVEIDELKRVYAETPERLRPVDFYRIAQTYPERSQEFEEVLLKASEIYPHDSEAAINAANILMRHGDLEEASKKISFAGESGEAYYTRGMLAALNDDSERAQMFFQKALELGVEKADTQLKMIEKNKKRNIITYLIAEEGE